MRMNKSVVTLVFVLISFIGFAQRDLDTGSLRKSGQGQGQDQRPDTQTTKAKDDMPPATDYKLIGIERDTTFVDTSLSIHKQYKMNYLRQDNFELLKFHNVAMPFNKLGYDFSNSTLNPSLGASAKHFNYLDAEQINYYETPTPLTEMWLRTVLEQGQNLKTLFANNITPRLNFSVGYEGLRSLGHYVQSRSDAANFFGTLNYRTTNDRYFLRLHVTKQDFENQQNGGFTDDAIEGFVNQIPEFDNRVTIEPQFRDANTRLLGRRLYLDQDYILLPGKDSTANNQVRLSHSLKYEYKNYFYNQSENSSIFGPAYETSNINDRVNLEELTNQASVSYFRNDIGKLAFKASHTGFNYGYNSIVITEDQVIPNLINGDLVAVGASYKNKIGLVDLEGETMHNIIGDFNGSYIKGRAGAQFSKDLRLDAKLNISSVAPDFNYQLFQSSYINYNWNNDFSNIQTQFLGGKLSHQKWGYVEGSFTQIQNYTFFGAEIEEFTSIDDLYTNVSPQQADSDVSYFKLRAGGDYNLGWFGMAHTLQYQNVLSGADVLPVPELITRNSFFYQDYWFQKATFVQTGFTFKYFTDFNAQSFNPILNEFVVQNAVALDGFYTFDVFFNAKIRTARVFFNLENVTEIFTGNKNFSAPGYPFRDFTFRFGVVWNLFL